MTNPFIPLPEIPKKVISTDTRVLLPWMKLAPKVNLMLSSAERNTE